MQFDIIVMTCCNDGIGVKGTIPWSEPVDMKYFRETTTFVEDITKKNAVIMGRRTFESMKEKPLKNRANYVISSRKKDINDVYYFEIFEKCLENIKLRNDIENIFIIGGSRLYEEAMKHKDCRYIYKNVLDEEYCCDTFFPRIPEAYSLYKSTTLTSKIKSYIYQKN